MGDLKDLEPLAKRLNAATDELNESLQTIQDKLNALGLGLEVWCGELSASDWRDILDRDSEPTGAREYTAEELGYGRSADGWALLVRTRRYVEGTDARGFASTDTYVDDHEYRPLLRASRLLRLAAAPMIPELIDALKAAAVRAIGDVEQAKKTAESLE